VLKQAAGAEIYTVDCNNLFIRDTNALRRNDVLTPNLVTRRRVSDPERQSIVGVSQMIVSRGDYLCG
jgi:hypothetical protein